MSDSEKTPEQLAQEAVDAREARRAARRKESKLPYLLQRAKDLDALDELEIEHGHTNVAALDVDFQPDLPTMVVVKAPKRAYVKRYQDSVKPRGKDGKPGDMQAAQEQLAAVCIVYPDLSTDDGKEIFERMVEARPGLRVQCGGLALTLAVGREQEAGKD